MPQTEPFAARFETNPRWRPAWPVRCLAGFPPAAEELPCSAELLRQAEAVNPPALSLAVDPSPAGQRLGLLPLVGTRCWMNDGNAQIPVMAPGPRRPLWVRRMNELMLQEATATESFTEFAREAEPRIRHALIPLCGVEAAEDATAEALEYGWKHWSRVQAMDNPVGYLYRVGCSRTARARRRKVGFPPAPKSSLPWVEPALPTALARLSDKQRTVVWLVHGLGWHQTEVAELLGLSPPTVQTHARRGMAKLRSALGGTP